MKTDIFNEEISMAELNAGAESHVIFGAGLIGCYLGGALMEAGRNVALVCRPSIQQKLALQLLLTDYLEHRVRLDAPRCVDPEHLAKAGPGELACDVLWLTVKCTGIKQALKDIAPLVGPHTRIYCCQNGLGSTQQVRAAYSGNPVAQVMVPFNVVELAPGHFHRGSEGRLTLQALDETEKALAKSINSELLPSTSTDEIVPLQWAKLQLNLGNCVNALADIPVKAMLEQRGYRRIIAVMMDELLAVAKARQMKLPKVAAMPGAVLPFILRLPDWLFRLVAHKMLAMDPTVRTSMWWDLDAGKPTEIDYLNGAVVDEAERLGVSCPVNRAMVDLVHSAERHQIERGLGADKMWLLLQHAMTQNKN